MGGDYQSVNFGQSIDNLLTYTIAKVFIFGTITHVHERKNGNGGFRRLG